MKILYSLSNFREFNTDFNYILKVITSYLLFDIYEEKIGERTPWFIHNDNVIANLTLLFRHFCAKNQISVLSQPPHSPDLAPCDFSYFRN